MEEKNKIHYLKYVPIILIALILYEVIINYKYFFGWAIHLNRLLLPFYWSIGIAYILNPLMKWFERKFKSKRLISLIFVYIIFIGIIAFSIGIITPKFVSNIRQLIREFPTYVEKTRNYIEENNDKIKYLERYDAYLKDKLLIFAEKMGSNANILANIIFVRFIRVTKGITSFIIGTLISVYMLKDKEKFLKSGKRIVFSIVGVEKGNSIIPFYKEADKIFSRYVVGKIIDSSIIGAMCFVGLSLMKSPFYILISIVVGITNMIPYFGPFIGMIFGGLVVVFTNPLMALYVFIFLFLLQQFDGFYLGPKILGDAVGLNPVWIILSVLLGGGFFGIIGMFLGVPFTALIKLLLNRNVDRRLKDKSITI